MIIDLRREACASLIVDLQGNLFRMMKEYDEILKKANIMLKVCERMEIPLLLTEQYRKGLGATDPLLNIPAEGTYAYEDKSTFSSYTGAIEKRLLELQKKYVIISGVEAHICVWQTARDLLKNGFIPVVLEDAIASRDPINKQNAVATIRQMGGAVLNLETVLFDLLKASTDPLFKEFSKLIK